jgi:hypothetical protein
MPEVPEKGLHRNRAISVPTDNGPRNCFSRSDILSDATPAAWGSEQSAEIAVDGEKKTNPDTWPKKWYTKGRCLRMPKTVILSSFPFWTLYWPGCYFNMPRDVIGDDGYGQLGNYYYLDQWNFLDMSANPPPDYSWASGPDLSSSSDGYQNNSAWDQFKFLNPSDKSTIYNAQSACQAMAASTLGDPSCDSVPSYLFNMCPTPPSRERYQQQVGQVTNNPYYQDHPQYLAAFLAAKQILENDPKDPIYVVIPAWLDPQLVQVRNAFLTMTHEQRNAAHGGAVNYRPCDVSDAIPCYVDTQICWAPAYPDRNGPSFTMPFNGPQIPWLMSSGRDPGVGTNTLHIYIGHPNMSFFATNNDTDYQAWPFTPEVAWIAAAVYSGTYPGSPLPFFAGRRAIWRAPQFSLDYGYSGTVTPQSVWNSRYKFLVGGAADQYKQRFWQHRNFGTRIFTYDPNWIFQWYFDNLDGDRRNDCPSTQAYFGFDFADFASSYDNTDFNVTDCADMSPGHTKFAETHNYFPLYADIQRAKFVGNQLRQRVESYYTSNDAGAGEFFGIALEQTGLADYNASYEGKVPGSFKTADGIVEYVREYFKQHP